MKVIQVMAKNNDHVCDSHFGLSSLLVTFLSVLKWKSFGHTVKLYVDEHFKEVFQNYGLLELYDEVDDTYFTENDLYESFDIKKEYFWAFSKLFIYMKEKDNFIMSDLDFIPLQDFHNIIDESKDYIYYKEILDKLKSLDIKLSIEDDPLQHVKVVSVPKIRLSTASKPQLCLVFSYSLPGLPNPTII